MILGLAWIVLLNISVLADETGGKDLMYRQLGLKASNSRRRFPFVASRKQFSTYPLQGEWEGGTESLYSDGAHVRGY